MAHTIIADAGPLIACAKIGNLHLLRQLFGQVWISRSVKGECLAKPGQDADRITIAIDDGWLIVKTIPESHAQSPNALGEGEMDSIQLALQSPESILFIVDDRLARRHALAYGLNIIGTVRLLDLAEKQGHICSTEQLLHDMCNHGYRISSKLLLQIRSENTQ